MTPYFDDGQVTLYSGSAMDVLRDLPDESVQCVITSPPYWALRAYRTEAQVWGGDAEHSHEWGTETLHKRTTGVDSPGPKQSTNSGALTIERGVAGAYCPCGAWRGELGHEPTPQMFVSHLVDVFREVRRVLKSDGCLFVNLGDSYSGSGKGPSNSLQRPASSLNNGQLEAGAPQTEWIPIPPGTKAKSLVLVPERFAIAMADDGWIVRSRIAWCKRAPMPESVRDRPTTAWEHIWMFTKSARYFWDQEAVREAHTGPPVEHFGTATAGPLKVDPSGQARALVNHLGKPREYNPAGRNMWNYWLISPDPEPLAHFATFPREIPRRCIAAATSEKGECPKCGKSWVRTTETVKGRENIAPKLSKLAETGVSTNGTGGSTLGLSGSSAGWNTNGSKSTITGWAPQCDHDLPPVPSVVLDPFVGSGTTTMVARSMLRRSIGIDLNETYLRDIALKKNAQMAMIPDLEAS